MVKAQMTLLLRPYLLSTTDTCDPKVLKVQSVCMLTSTCVHIWSQGTVGHSSQTNLQMGL